MHSLLKKPRVLLTKGQELWHSGLCYSFVSNTSRDNAAGTFFNLEGESSLYCGNAQAQAAHYRVPAYQLKCELSKNLIALDCCHKSMEDFIEDEIYGLGQAPHIIIQQKFAKYLSNLDVEAAVNINKGACEIYILRPADVVAVLIRTEL